MKKVLLFFVTTLSIGSYAQSLEELAQKVNRDDFKTHLSVLASDEYEGRETGMEGQKKAARYIEEYFSSLGYSGVVNGSFQQVFPITLEKPGSSLALSGNDLKFIDDFFYVGSYQDTVIRNQEMIFVGYGIENEQYSSYGNLDVKGKVVIMLDGQPLDKKGNPLIKGGLGDEWVVDRTKKSKLAASKGASGAIVILDDYNRRVAQYKNFILNPRIRLKKPQSKGKTEFVMPVFYGNKSLLSKLYFKAGKSLTEYKGISEGYGKVQGIPLITLIDMELKRDIKESTSSNVMAFLEGSDLKDEVIVISAHYDHIGKDGDKVFNGADDDGSGTVAVMGLAKAFMDAKKAGKGPRRSVLFLLVSGEEKGLLGSEWYTDNPIFPLGNTVADLNIDMIGRQDKKYANNENYVYLIGSDKLSSDLHRISEEANQKYCNLILDYTYNDPADPNRYYYRSDHYNFAKNNIPVIFYFNGTHEDYHKETDEVEKINFSKMEKITRLVFYTAYEIANRQERLRVDKKNDFK